MITRPLELASRLRPEPRGFDWLFYVNVGLLALFFSLFGSRFVLAPGLPVGFRLPTVQNGEAPLAVTTHRISVAGPSLMFVNDGAINSQKDLEVWLDREAKKTKHPSLLILMSAEVPMVVFADMSRAASRAGFEGVYLGTQEAKAAGAR